MRPTPYIYIIGILSLLAAACSDDFQPTFTVGAEHNAITLRAAIGSGEEEVASRAPDLSHENHVAFNSGLLHLRVDGIWKGHSPEAVHKEPFGTVGYVYDEEGSFIYTPHNPLTLSPPIFWDDFGTADPANMKPVEGNGREKGLSIFGVTVDGYWDGTNYLPKDKGGNNLDEILDWTAIPWTLPLDQTDKPTNFDLLTSNNIQKGKDGTLKFDHWKAKADSTSDLLVFTHAMSKISVKLTADEGFKGYDYVNKNNANAKFENPPKVTLLNYYYKGNVDVEKKVSTPTPDQAGQVPDQGDIIAHIGGVESPHFAHSYALVFPGNSFADTVNVVRIEADGNTYYVTAAQMNAAMKAVQGADKDSTTYLQGKHYIFNVIVKKTGVDVTATIKDWEKVEAEKETPIINFSECYGHTGTELTTPFSLYRSTTIDGTYTGASDQAVVSYSGGKYTMSPQLYWPDHQTHYFFRGIWPEVGDEDGHGPAADKITDNCIEVENAPYNSNKYPSDLMIGRPRVAAGGAPDETCKNPAHQREDGTYPAGICATDSKDESSGLIRMNFQYAMSQVIVKLTTSDGQANALTINKYTKVEIVGGYSEGKIHLGTGASDFTGKTVTPYPMTNDNGIDNPVEGNDYANYRNTIIPQALTNASGDLKFRITISANGSATDAYETVLGIKEIKVTEGGVLKNITAWEPGKRYIYNLHITKTGISVTATVTDWKTVDASEDIWM